VGQESQEGELAVAKELTAQEFDSEVLQGTKPVLVDFFATWCGPCRMQTPVLEGWAGKNAENVHVVKLDVDKAPEVASKYGVMSIPTLVLFHAGKEAARVVGFQNDKALDTLLAKAKS
jgi:thioredoxin 1